VCTREEPGEEPDEGDTEDDTAVGGMREDKSGDVVAEVEDKDKDEDESGDGKSRFSLTLLFGCMV
jgi:hypothetical protein